MISILQTRFIAVLASTGITILLFAITFLGYDGFANSLTFDGGLRLVIQLPENIDSTEQIQEAIAKEKLPTPLTRLSNPRLNIWDIEFDEAQKQEIEKILNASSNDTLITEISARIQDGFDNRIGEDNFVATEILSASYGANLFLLSIKILIYTMIGIGSYLAFRFSFAFSLGAILALVHDLILTLGFIGAMQIKPSIPVLAAVLTLLGYSINDTIVIFDRIRENKGKNELTPMTIDVSIVQTLSRTIVTAVLTLLSVIALWLSGESSLRDFALIMIWGVGIGTYSSIMIAAPLTYDLHEYLRKRKANQATRASRVKT